ncbi:hypothetical protein [Paracoccus sp. S1E-3]|uniref:hypothetical protein n=1 Tax=Paracoccus sp. S1E-3 TaxID=2756130 RepID=UPI0015EF466F|nr:hypothetical protein [Paracoccus sp. S1E-3]MBA4492659.1 hypothetical protein [Paracoccus sp. S1E-3]
MRLSTLPANTPVTAPPPARSAEVFAAPDGAFQGFVMAHLQGPVLWLQDRQSARLAGRPSLAGALPQALLMRPAHPRDVLIAAEEGLACPALSAVVAEIHGNPTALNFTATRRLALRAEAHGVTLWLIRHAARPEPSALRDRWQVTALPSAPNPDDAAAPGAPLWRVELLRARDKRPGVWVVSHEAGSDGAPDRLHFAAEPARRTPDAATGTGSAASGGGPAGGQRATG